MAGQNILHLTDEEFEQKVLQSDQPVLVDFWAAWCGPCKAVAPTIEALADDYAGRVRVCKMNVDQNPRTPGQYGIRAIPTLIVFKGGEVVEQITGAVSKAHIEIALGKAL